MEQNKKELIELAKSSALFAVSSGELENFIKSVAAIPYTKDGDQLVAKLLSFFKEENVEAEKTAEFIMTALSSVPA